MPDGRPVGQYALIGLIAGVALGLFSGLGDQLPADTPLHVAVALANAAGPWLVTAFAVGALVGTPVAGAITATLALIAAVATYYLTIYALGFSVADLMRSAGVWLAVSIVVGPVLGAAGGAWRRPRRPLHRIGAAALLAGALAAEGVLRLIQVEAWTGLDLARTDIQVGLIELAAAAVLPAVLLSSGERLRGYLATAGAAVGATLVTAGALTVIQWVLLG
ncbi:MAG TPA: DUF6518 family protein [Candidatus Limnocylindria bacterium]